MSEFASESSVPRIPLSILDLSPVPAGGTAADALRNSVDLARVAERAGYRRYWVAEHHLASGVASSSTPVLAALIASATSRIRVGSGAVQLPVTSPLQAAEQFGTVAALHPGRVDLGLGRFDIHKILRLAGTAPKPDAEPPPAPPSRVVDGLLIPPPARFRGDLSTYVHLARLLGIREEDPAPDYDTQVGAILDYLGGAARRPDGQPVTVPAAEGADLDVWILGSSPGESAQVAGARGLPFAASYHTSPGTVLDTVDAYRRAFRPSARLAAPHVVVSADVVVADTQERAEELAAPYAQWVLDIRTGVGARPYVAPGQARAREWTPAERAIVADRVDTQFVGSPATVVEGLATLARVTGADELLITTITTEHGDRVRSTELLARAWAEHAGRRVGWNAEQNQAEAVIR
ncbi:luciferase family oxidoreductase group 1 [Pseudonocardia hierapolitana]|uniref:Luciferase family oxidoreductase group 1 n=1 Tax=Pseudonocardia hierapolitana TaxID=1128676 RepID=A0A561SYB5_9PSEU|nr:LLM class flavin-dependent oxidoreductase [Pseudonocardia hierapolitana]TWF79831.1 luciferase family oxidoreductase group 1 [Pseudonocardia hierapolitana]